MPLCICPPLSHLHPHNALLQRALRIHGFTRRLALSTAPASAARCLPPTSALEAGNDSRRKTRPFVTLTYAVSLDSMIAAAPGTRTVLSGPASKAMTHYLRSRHDAICVGAGTAIADDPTLNSRLSDALGNLDLQPRPVVLDRRGRWSVSRESKVIQAAVSGLGKAPWIICEQPAPDVEALQAAGGALVADAGHHLPAILESLKQRGIDSIMIEGGSEIIKTMLSRHIDLIDSLIITIAPVFLGDSGVNVAPSRNPDLILIDTAWMPLDADVVMCSHVKPTHPLSYNASDC